MTLDQILLSLILLALLRIVFFQSRILKQEKKMSAQNDQIIADLNSEIESQTTLADSLKVFIQTLEDAKDDPAKLTAILSNAKSNTAKFAALLASNTDAAPSTPGATDTDGEVTPA